MSISNRPYGHDQYQHPATEYTLTNASGASVSILDFGAIITRICVPDRSGKLGDVSLGFDEADRYTHDSGSMGTLVGRTGNRIAGATFELEGKTYTLGKNSLGKNNLHGGPEGFGLKMWNAMPIQENGKDTLRMTLYSPDLDQGFPGAVTVIVDYTFDDENNLGIHYHATTSKTTLINLTNHAYFNLNGHEAGTVHDLELQVNADEVTEVGEGLIPTGALKPVKGLPYDFTVMKPIGDALEHTETCPDMKLAGGVDFNYCAGRDRETKLIAVLYSPKTGREMRVVTDQPGVQIYTGQGLHQVGKDGVQYVPYAGVCLETQHYADSIHHPHFPSTVLRPQDVFDSDTVYQFRIR